MNLIIRTYIHKCIIYTQTFILSWKCSMLWRNLVIQHSLMSNDFKYMPTHTKLKCVHKRTFHLVQRFVICGGILTVYTVTVSKMRLIKYLWFNVVNRKFCLQPWVNNLRWMYSAYSFMVTSEILDLKRCNGMLSNTQMLPY